MHKRLLSILMSAAMVLTAVPMTAYASQESQMEINETAEVDESLENGEKIMTGEADSSEKASAETNEFETTEYESETTEVRESESVTAEPEKAEAEESKTDSLEAEDDETEDSETETDEIEDSETDVSETTETLTPETTDVDIPASGKEMSVFGGLTVNNGLKTVHEDTTLSEDVSVSGGMTISGGCLDLNGHMLEVDGDLHINDGYIYVNEGTLTVNGSMYIGEKGEMSTESGTGKETHRLATSSGYIKMNNDEDLIEIAGDLTVCSSKQSYLYRGKIMIGGSIYQYGTGEGSKYAHRQNFDVTFGTVEFTGTKPVEIYFDSTSSGFYQTKFNKRDIILKSAVRRLELDSDVKLTVDTENRELTVTDVLILNGHRLTIPHEVNFNGGDNGGIEIEGGELDIDGELRINSGYISTYNKGALIVNGSMYIGEKGEMSTESGTGKETHRLATSSGYIKMYNDEDLIEIAGDLTVCSSKQSKLNGGKIKIAGNMYQYGTGDGAKYAHRQNFDVTFGTVEFTGTEPVEIYFDSTSSGFWYTKFNKRDIILKSAVRRLELDSDVKLTVDTGNRELTVTDVLTLNGHRLTIPHEVNFNGGDNGGIEIEGGELDIDGELRINSGYISTYNKGALIVNGSMYIGEKGEMSEEYGTGKETHRLATSSGYIKMYNDEDLIEIAGDLTVCSSKQSKLNDGKIKIAGNMYQYGTGDGAKYAHRQNFDVTGSTTVEFTGTKPVEIYFDSTSSGFYDTKFNKRDIILKSAVRKLGLDSDVKLTVDTENRELTVTDVLALNGHRLTIPHEVNFNGGDNGGIEIEGGELDIDGELRIKSGYIDVDGKLIVNGSMYMGEKGEMSKESGTGKETHRLATSSGYIKMLYDEALIEIAGDLTVCSSKQSKLDGGKIKITGNMYQYGTGDSAKYANCQNFDAESYHTVEFAGTKPQSIYFESTKSGFGNVKFTGRDITVNSALRGLFILDKDLRLTVGTKDATLDISGEIDLNGHTLTIPHSLLHKSGVFNLNNGTLQINGDYRQGEKGDTDGSGHRLATSTAYMIMEEERDHVIIDGSFETCTNANTEYYMTGGVVEIKGDFFQYGTYPTGGDKYACAYNYSPSESHTTFLKSKEKQKAVFESDKSKFNILQLTRNESEYELSPTKCYNQVKIITVEEPDKEPEKILSPVSSIESGSEVSKGTELVLSVSGEKDAKIYYTVDGSEPTKESAVYDKPIIINKDMTIKAFASKEGFKDSDIVTFTYKVKTETKPEEPEKILSPVSSIESGSEVSKGTELVLSVSGEKDAKIYYTVDGSEPTKESAVYDKPIIINKDMTIKAFASKEGFKDSDIVTFIYKVKTETKPEGSDVPSEFKDGLWIYGLDENGYTYTGDMITPSIKVYDRDILLTENTDYTIAYKNNKKAAKSGDGNKAPMITVTGKGNYSGKETKAFTILPAELTSGDVYVEALYIKAGNKAQKPVPKIYYKGTLLKNNTDYTITYDNSSNIYSEEGEYALTVEGKGNFAGRRQITFSAVGKVPKSASVNISKASVSGLLKTAEYTGQPITQSCKLFAKGRDGIEMVLEEGIDYSVGYSKNLKAGTATVTFYGKNGYTGKLKKTFRITQYGIDGASIKCVLPDDGNVPYAKGGCMPKPAITFNGTLLREGVDYTLSYKNNKAVNQAKTPMVVVKGKGNFKGSRVITFSIAPQDLSKMTLVSGDRVYAKKANIYKITPKLNDLDGKALSAGKDFDKKNVYYTYKNDVILENGVSKKAGDSVEKTDVIPVNTEIEITISSIQGGSYTGTFKGIYRIVKADIKSAKVTVAPQTYTGSAITPDKSQIKVTVAGRTLEADEYDIVSYANNIKKGNGKMTIRGKGNNYGGEKTVTFSIRAKGFVK